MPTDSVKIHATGFAPIARKAGSRGEGLFFFHFRRLLQTKDQYYASTTRTGVNGVHQQTKSARLKDRTETKHNAEKTDKARVKSRAPIRSKPSSTFARSRVKRGGTGSGEITRERRRVLQRRHLTTTSTLSRYSTYFS